jgi:hypothetical protein
LKALLLVLGMDSNTSDGQLLERVTAVQGAANDAAAARARVAELESAAAKHSDAIKRCFYVNAAFMKQSQRSIASEGLMVAW